MLSCQETEGVDPNGGTNPGADQAYVSFSITAPVASRADGDIEDALPAENAVTDVALLAFDSKYNFIGSYTNGELTTSTNGNPLYKCIVANDACRFFVVANYTANTKIEDAIYSMSGVGAASNSLYEALTFTQKEVADMAVEGKFVMVNAGTFDVANNEDISLVSLPEGTVLSQDKDNPTVLPIAVDRILSKFKFTVADPLVLPSEDDHAEILGARLHATNTKAFAYSKINTVSTLGNADYRIDPNMRLDATNAATELNWLKNTRDEETFYAQNLTEYVLENTCDGTFHDYNNLTQAVVKAVYTPAGLGLKAGDSWFVIHVEGKGELEMSFATLVDFYEGNLDAEKYGNVSDEMRTNLDSQLNHILSFSEDATVNGGGLNWNSPEVTLAVLDAVKFGGYRAATAEDNFIKYYQNSINYYDIFIQHDDLIDPGHLSRWGMVRNNSYTMNVKSIKAAGLPYIPSPFDEDILDPDNPNPEIPEPADKLDGFIDAEIIVNGWTAWSQDTDLM